MACGPAWTSRVTFDYVALWALTVANSLILLLLIRYVARMPQLSRRADPAPGTPVPPWSLTALGGSVVRSEQMPSAYTLLFLASGCKPCHALLTELRAHGRPTSAALVAVGRGDVQALAQEAAPDGVAVYDHFLVDPDGALSRQLRIPGTPYAVSVHDGRIVRGGSAPTASDLDRIASTTRTAASSPA